MEGRFLNRLAGREVIPGEQAGQDLPLHNCMAPRIPRGGAPVSPGGVSARELLDSSGGLITIGISNGRIMGKKFQHVDR